MSTGISISEDNLLVMQSGSGAQNGGDEITYKVTDLKDRVPRWCEYCEDLRTGFCLITKTVKTRRHDGTFGFRTVDSEICMGCVVQTIFGKIASSHVMVKSPLDF
jgi:hypothetical protein